MVYNKNIKFTISRYFCQNIELSVRIVLISEILRDSGTEWLLHVFVFLSGLLGCPLVIQARVCPHECTDNPPRPEVCGDGSSLSHRKKESQESKGSRSFNVKSVVQAIRCIFHFKDDVFSPKAPFVLVLSILSSVDLCYSLNTWAYFKRCFILHW